MKTDAPLRIVPHANPLSRAVQGDQAVHTAKQGKRESQSLPSAFDERAFARLLAPESGGRERIAARVLAALDVPSLRNLRLAYPNSRLCELAFDETWGRYSEATREADPVQTLVGAVKALSERGSDVAGKHAVDIACGAGRDTRLLLGEGMTVHAIDLFAGNEEILRESIRSGADGLAASAEHRLRFSAQSMEDLELVPGKASIINSSYGLPFCSPARFPHLWQQINDGLCEGGVVCGQLFGVQHGFNSAEKDMTFHTRKEVEALLEPFNIIQLEETNTMGNTACNKDSKVRWHVFDFIAQKKSS